AATSAPRTAIKKQRRNMNKLPEASNATLLCHSVEKSPRPATRCRYARRALAEARSGTLGSRPKTRGGPSMSKLDFVIEEIVTANRILANEGIVDSFGHVSARHPDKPDHYLLSRARAPERIEASDIVEYKLDGTP